MNVRSPRHTRHGALAPLAALLTIPLLAMLAFSVDMSYIVLTRTELQAAADAGALAAAQSLQAGYIQYNQTTNPISTYTSAATTVAKNIVQANSAGGQTLVFNSSTDITFGYTDPSSGTYTTPTNYYPNTVMVTARRDSTGSHPLKLFFGPVLGTKQVNVLAEAGATLRTGTISPPTYAATVAGGFNSGILPLTYNVNWWNNFLQTGRNPDGSIPSVIDGLSFVTAFGGGGSSNQLGQANWGWLSLDDSHVGASTLSNWVTNGMSSSDYAALQSANLLPLSLHNSTTAPTSSNGPSGSFNWLGDNGAKVAVAHTINSDAGQLFLIPLYQPVFAPSSGSLPSGVNVGDAGIGGSNQFYFNIVAFAPVVIIYDGDSNTVAIAPSSSYPPGVTFSNQTVANTSAAQGTASSNSMIFVPAALTY
jgi:Flp pilus assembly protein TadG